MLVNRSWGNPVSPPISANELKDRSESRSRSRPYYLSLAPLLYWPACRRPLDLAEHFGRSAPVEIEIGFGNGEALVRRARNRPGIDFIGIEITWDSIKRALRRIAQTEIKNVRLIQAEAWLVAERLIPPQSVAAWRSFFPPPWPKARHAARRLFSSDFLRLIGNRLENDGLIQIVTDYRPYLEWIVSQTTGSGMISRWGTTPARFETRYERKWQAAGQELFYEIFLRKIRHVDIPLVEDLELQTIRLTGFNPGRFDPLGIEGPITVKFKEIVHDQLRRKLLVRAFVAEDRLIQDVWIKVAADGERWSIQLAKDGLIVPTAGVKLAIELVHQAAERSV